MAVLTGLFRLGRDAELRRTPAGDAVLNLALAYNYGQKSEDGNKLSQWIDAALFGKRAEALAPHLTKGSSIVATLSDVHVRTYAKKDGTQAATLSGRVMDLEFAGRPAGESRPAPKPSPARKDEFVDSDLSDIPF